MTNQKGVSNIFLNSAIAQDYDAYYISEAGKVIDKIEQDILLPHLRSLPGGPLLELGCGTGHWTRFLAGLGFEVTAIDESEAMLEVAVKKNITNASFRKADALHLPFEPNSFPVVVAITMLEFVEAPEKVMDEIDRVLQPGGTVVLACLNANSVLGKTKNSDPVFQYGRFFKPGEIIKILSRFGEPRLSSGVHFSPGFEILDGTEREQKVSPAFIAASVKT